MIDAGFMLCVSGTRHVMCWFLERGEELGSEATIFLPLLKGDLFMVRAQSLESKRRWDKGVV